MNLYSHITFSAFLLYLISGIYVLYQDYKLKLNRIFFFLSMALSIWCFGSTFFYISLTSEGCWIWYKILSIGQSFYVPCTLLFFLALTRKNAILKKWWIYALLYIPPTIVVFKFFTGFVIVKDFEIMGPGQVKMVFDYSFWFFVHVFFQLAYSFGIIAITFHWRYKLKYRTEKRQALVIIIPNILTLIIAIIIGIILPMKYNSNTAPLTPVAVIFSEVGIWYAVVKYKILVLTPSLAAESILDTMVDSVVLVDPELNILTVNNETCKMLEYNEAELIGKELKVLFHHDELFNKCSFLKILEDGSIRNFEEEYVTKNGKFIPVVFSASKHRDKDGNLIGIVVISRDITERKNVEERLKYLAHHDFLTGLPNRLLFSDRLKQALSLARRHNTLTAIILLDVDRFKEVNDALGHNNGDTLLIQIADRLKGIVRKSDTFARLGGDEFVFILNDLKSIGDAEEVAKKINKAFVEKFTIHTHELHITASLGISIYPTDGDDPDALVKNADLAMYHAKNQGKDNFQLFTHSLGITSSERLLLESGLRKAIERNEVIVHYQPMVDINTGTIVCIEALVRWQHPELGLIPPAKFIPIAEETGLIVQIGEFVLRTACRQNKRWIEEGLNAAPVAVNLSACQFKQKDLIDTILKILEENELEPRFLELEITESTAMFDADKTAVVLNMLYEHGIMFSIDDFGMGYSSLNYLRKFPIRTIKIDKFFIQNIDQSPNDAAIVTAILAMAHMMKLKVIAEGVETQEQLEFLRSLQWKFIGSLICDGVQGYYFSKPVSAENLSLLLNQQKELGGILTKLEGAK